MTNSGLLQNIKPQPLRALLRTELGPVQSILSPWLIKDQSCLLWAQTGLGKTWFSLSVAVVAAGGGTLFDRWECKTPRRVLIVDGEMSVRELKERLKLLVDSLPLNDKEAALDNLHIYDRMSRKPSERFVRLEEPDWQDALVKYVEDKGFDLVILDNLTTLCEVQDENSASAMYPVLDLMKRFKQAKVGCILVHHSGKNSETFRGSSALAATFEVIIGLVATTDADGDKPGASFNVTWTKYRGLKTEAVQDFRADLVPSLDEHRGHGVSWETHAGTREVLRKLAEIALSGEHPTDRETFEALPEDMKPTAWEKKEDGAKRAHISRMFRAMYDEGLATKGDIKEARKDRPMPLSDDIL